MQPQKLILIIEDNEDARRVFGAILNYDGYRVAEADDGEAGVARAVAELPDLIITDIDMPVLDGFGAARRLRADPRTAGIPIVAVTGHEFFGAQAELAQDLFNCTCAKPVLPSRVLAEVQRLIGPPGG